jgi:hypothetical protein
MKRTTQILTLVSSLCLFYFIFYIFSSEKIYSSLGNVPLNIAYSIMASVFFYWIAIYIPYQRKKINLIVGLNIKIMEVAYSFRALAIDLNLSGIDYKEFDILNSHLKKFNPDNPFRNYISFHKNLNALRTNTLSLINNITKYHEYLEEDVLTELMLIENHLLIKNDIFNGDKNYLVSNLSYASLTFQELLIHSSLLELKWEKEFNKYKNNIDKESAKYRRDNYE